MKKSVIIVLSLIFLIVLGIIWEFKNQQELTPSSPDTISELPTEEQNKIKKNEESEETTTNDITPAKILTNEFAAIIKSTINYFSGKDTYIVAIGDSLTQGIGDSTGQGGYVGILDKHLNANTSIVTFENFGKRGNRTDHLLKRLDQEEIQKSIKNADIIIITIGANDIMQVVKENFMDLTYEVFSKNRGHYENRLRKIFTKITEMNDNASVYLVGFYNPFQQYFEHIKELDMIVDEWNYTSKQVAEEFDAVFIPTKDLFITEDVNLFADDHFHPNEYGYQKMAERILNYLVIE